MKRIFCFLVGIAVALFSTTAMGEVIYQSPDVRFTLISPSAIRLEYAPDGKFVNDSSQVAVVRDYPKVSSKISRKGGWVVITTSQMELRYKEQSGQFKRDNLSIKSLRKDKQFVWYPGVQQLENLKGTYRTLDRYDGDVIHEQGGDKKIPIEDGLLARDGWTLIDDSNSYLFDNSEWAWVKERNSVPEAQDWYFLIYGQDYKQALKDFTAFAGKIPLPPRYAFGFWWSRYWSYSDRELRDLVSTFKSHSIPLDVLVIDMDWHYTESGRGGWTGYTWNRSLFPNPQGILKFIKDNNLKITMNLHPASGIYDYEEKFSAMLKSLKLPGDTKHIDHVSSDKAYVSAWMKNILHPQMQDGVDFWWLDWQQYPNDKRLSGLSNTWWLNYVFFSDMERSGDTRPMLYHRWGGLGNHRYQIGFSGDAHITWNSLDFQPYFNHTASNVLYGYWSHDIGGHMKGIGKIEPEMFTRWMQFGMLSPILRAHSTKNGALRKEPWSFDNETYTNLKNIINDRYRLSPYIYTMARQAYENGVSLCRPMYYDYPAADEAYSFRNEYMFGDKMLVMPITKPMQGDFSEVEVWLPGGDDWYELSTGTLLKGGERVHRKFAIDEYPVYVKAGSIIPMAPGQMSLADNDYAYEMNVYPGGDSSFEVYEDNGNDKNYDKEYALTRVTTQRDGDKLKIAIEPRKGRYADMPQSRKMSVRVHGRAVASDVKLNGNPIASTYDGETLSTLIELPSDPTQRYELIVTYPDDTVLADGTVGQFRRIYKATSRLKDANDWKFYNDAVADVESAPMQINYYPERFSEIMAAYRKGWNELPQRLLKLVKNKDYTPEQAAAKRDAFLQRIDWQKVRLHSPIFVNAGVADVR